MSRQRASYLLVFNCCFFSLFAVPAFAAMSISPSPSFTGNYTVSFGLAYNTSWTFEENINSGGYNAITDPTSGATSKAFSGKAAGTYMYRIRWWNAGDNAWEPIAGPVSVTVQPPDLPTGLTSPATDDDGSFTVDWANATGATDYDLGEKFNTDAWTTISNITTSTKSRSGLADGSWKYRVRACSAVGCSAWTASGDMPVTDVARTPGAPGVPSVSPATSGTGSHTVSWTNASGTVTYYELQANKDSAGYSTITPGPGTNLSLARSSLADGSYLYRVRGCNTVGGYTNCGAWATATTAGIITSIPTPTGLSIDGTSPNYTGGYTVTWNSVSGATSYQLQQRTNGGSWINQNPSGTSKAYTGQTAAAYGYQVQACVGSSCGAWSAIVSRTVSTPPVPTGLAISGSNPNSTGAYTVSWNAAAGASSYQLQQQENGGSWANQNPTSTSKTYSAMLEKAFGYKVQACSNVGCSSWTSTQSVTVNYPAPGALPTFTVPAGSVTSTVGLSWTTASGYVTYHEVEKTTQGQSIITSTGSVALSYSATGLSNGSYQFRVRACNATSDCGAWSDSATTVVSIPSTETGPPGAPSDQVDSIEPLGAPFHGAVLGEATVGIDGAASYTIPIEVPPGTAGIHPDLQLRYDSQNGNGILGMGWTLGGLSRVSRCERTLAQDGKNDSIDFDANDVFCLDGQRLVAKTGNYGESGTEYRTEIDTFTKVISEGRLGTGGPGALGGPETFKAWTKSGLVLEFGYSPDSQIIASHRPDAFAWLLTRVIDRNGNYLKVTYVGSGSRNRPTLIEYTGYEGSPVQAPYASVQFIYEPGQRTDKVLRYVGGHKIEQTRRISNIQTKVGTTLVRDYQFGYDNAGAEGRSRLTTINECDGQGNCKLPLTLAYEDPSPDEFTTRTNIEANYGMQSNDWSAQGRKLYRGDFNGDGLTDVLLQDVDGTSPATYLLLADGAGGFLQRDNITTDYQMTAALWRGDQSVLHTGDFNGDGATDILLQPINSSFTATLLLSNGSGGFANSTDITTMNNGNMTASTWADDKRVLHTGDFNGDGATDILLQGRLVGSTTYNTYLILADGNGGFANKVDISTSYNLSELIWTTGKHVVRVGDFDANGADDLLLQGVDSTNSSYLLLSNGVSGFTNVIGITNTTGMDATKWQANERRAHVLDINDDGASDIILQNIDTTDAYSYLLLSNSAGGFADALDITSLYGMDGSQWQAKVIHGGDFNGDGVTDLLMQGANGTNTSVVLFGDGYGEFNTKKSISTLYGMATADWAASNHNLFVGDINGDGLSDILLQKILNADTGVYRLLSPDVYPDQLLTATSGLGLATTFIYKPLTEPSVYTKGASMAFPVRNVQDARYVASALKQSDGIGGDFRINFTYEGLRLDSLRRVGLGFAKITAVDVDRNTTTISEYEQGFPLTGEVKKRQKWITDTGNASMAPDRLVEEVTRTYLTKFVDSAPTPDIVFPYVNDAVTKLYDLTDGLLLSVTTNSRGGDVNVDSYGNFKKLTVTVEDKRTLPQAPQSPKFVTVIDRTFQNSLPNWIIGRVTQEEVHKETFDNNGAKTEDPNKDRTTTYVYDNGAATLTKGQLTQRTVEPGIGAPLTLVTTFGYDPYGNPSSESADPDTGIAGDERLESVEYDSIGRFPETLTNAMLHETALDFDDLHGQVSSIIDSNGLLTTINYDGFGRIKDLTEPNGAAGKMTDVGYFVVASDAGAPINAKILVDMEVQGNTRVRTFLDMRGRELRKRVMSFNGTDYVHVDTEYDSRGRALRSSQPYLAAGTPSWITPTYDELNRVTEVTSPDTTEYTATAYSGFAVTVTDAKGRRVTTSRNAIGNIINVEQRESVTEGGDLSSSLSYKFDVAGNPTEVINDAGGTQQNSVFEVYDRLGRKTQVTDQDGGITEFDYNAFGEVIRQVTPELAPFNKAMTLVYDALGRPISRVEPNSSASINDDLITNWHYDDTTSGNKGIGRLTRETSKFEPEAQNSFDRSFTYSSSAGGLLTAVQTAMWTPAKGSRSYSVGFTYDSARRVETIVYPMSPSFAAAPEPFTVQYTYNFRGYLEQVHQRENQAKTTLLYQVMASDALGRITKQYLGDTSVNTRGYETGSGRLTFTNASIDNGGTQVDVQNFVYSYDGVGNMLSRSDLLHNLTEKFTYDALERLRSAQVVGQAVKNYDYDMLGSITGKSDHGVSYNYSMVNAGRHAVTSVTTPAPGSQTLNYTYDANGNQHTALLSDGSSRQIDWQTYNLPGEIKIANSTVSHKFRYGPNRGRYAQEAVDEVAAVAYTDYVDEMYIKRTRGVDEEHKHYLVANGQRIGVLVDEQIGSTVTKQFRYFHLDHLGSVTNITDKQGVAINIESLSYDAFGRRRESSSWTGDPITVLTEERGYTGHEHLDDVGIIHMNGRVYDPILGRMLSPDPIVESPLFGQNWNRFSYVFNNPLKFTDPTGFCTRDLCGMEEVIVTGSWTLSDPAGVSFSGEGFDFGGEGLGPNALTIRQLTQLYFEMSEFESEEHGDESEQDSGQQGGEDNADGASPASLGNEFDNSTAIDEIVVTSERQSALDQLLDPNDISRDLAAAIGIGADATAQSFVKDGFWRGKNWKWNGNHWPGNGKTGARRVVKEVAASMKAVGSTISLVSLTLSASMQVDAFASGDYASARAHGVDEVMGLIGVGGGPAGLAVSGAYFLIDMIGFDTFGQWGASGMCGLSRNC